MIRSLVNGELIEVANVHLKVFPKNIHSRLGLEVVRRHFEWQLEKRSIAHANGVFDEETGQLLGFGFGGLYGEPTDQFMRGHVPLVISMAARRPRVALHLVSRHLIRRAKRSPDRSATWTNPVEDEPDDGVVKQKPVAGLMTGPNPSAVPHRLDQTLRYFEIFSLAVSPVSQGSGLGKLLMEDQESVALRLGFERVRLRAPLDNPNTIGFYERIGFQKALEQEGAWLGQMVKRL